MLKEVKDDCQPSAVEPGDDICLKNKLPLKTPNPIFVQDSFWILLKHLTFKGGNTSEYFKSKASPELS